MTCKVIAHSDEENPGLLKKPNFKLKMLSHHVVSRAYDLPTGIVAFLPINQDVEKATDYAERLPVWWNLKR